MKQNIIFDMVNLIEYSAFALIVVSSNSSAGSFPIVKITFFYYPHGSMNYCQQQK